MGKEQFESSADFRTALQLFGRSMSLDPDQLRRIGQDLISVADTISSYEGYVRHPVGMDMAATDERLANLASSIYQARRKRRNHFDPDLLGEPVWDMLLDIFIATVRKKQISVTSLCLASDVPPTTALRWVNALETRKLIERRQVQHDRRVSLLELTNKGKALVRDCLSEWLPVTLV